MGQLELFPGRRGRRRVLLDNRRRHVAEAMLRAGATTVEVAQYLGVSRPTARGLLGDHPSWPRQRDRDGES